MELIGHVLYIIALLLLVIYFSAKCIYYTKEMYNNDRMSIKLAAAVMLILNIVMAGYDSFLLFRYVTGRV